MNNEAAVTTLTNTNVTFERILIPTDFSDISDRAVEYAKSIARQANSQLLLVHVDEPVNSISPPEVAWIDRNSVVEKMEEQLEESGEALRSEGFQVKAFSVTGIKQSEIQRIVKEEEVRLIVLGTHARRGFERLMLGSDAEAVLRHVSCPVLTIGPAAPKPPDTVWRPKNIVCATTLDPNSARTAAYAYMLAGHFDARFALLNVGSGKSQSYAHDCNAFESAFRRQLPADVTYPPYLRTLLSSHTPAEEIVEYAKEQGVDLIIMGARTASALLTHFAPGTASRVFAQATCPVMTLREWEVSER
jgi:nucleotide-binding universal stress UspA family protein